MQRHDLKQKAAKVACTWITFFLIAIAVMCAAALISVRYATLIEKVDWSLVTIVSLLCYGGYMLYRWNSGEANYNVIDIITTDGKADLYKHLIVFFAGVAAWAIIKAVLAKMPVETLLLGVLGIFVGNVAVGGIAKAWQAKGASPAPPANINVANVANVDTEKSA